MSTSGLDVFDTTIQETNHWLKIMMGELGSDSRRTAFNALRAALHALRDRIGLENAVHLGAQLPMRPCAGTSCALTSPRWRRT